MKTEWDYTELAEAYLKRPDYAPAAIDAMLRIAGVRKGDPVCDVGAGVAHLTLMLAGRDLDVTAVEPNDAMREGGRSRTAQMSNVRWHEGTGEMTGQSEQAFELVTFGSSFNVCDRQVALKETARILKPAGWFACMWNHRSLEDPIQARVESIIKNRLADYSYGNRRADQTAEIDRSGLFGPVVHLNARVTHKQEIAGQVEAWRSHATLQRQAGDAFTEIVDEIEAYLTSLADDQGGFIDIPYTTNIWMAQRA